MSSLVTSSGRASSADLMLSAVMGAYDRLSKMLPLKMVDPSPMEGMERSSGSGYSFLTTALPLDPRDLEDASLFFLSMLFGSDLTLDIPPLDDCLDLPEPVLLDLADAKEAMEWSGDAMFNSGVPHTSQDHSPGGSLALLTDSGFMEDFSVFMEPDPRDGFPDLEALMEDTEAAAFLDALDPLDPLDRDPMEWSSSR